MDSHVCKQYKLKIITWHFVIVSVKRWPRSEQMEVRLNTAQSGQKQLLGGSSVYTNRKPSAVKQEKICILQLELMGLWTDSLGTCMGLN